jgi:OmpA-OmpF porin, OOP family
VVNRLILAAGAVILPSLAAAQADQGPYVSVDAGLNVAGALRAANEITVVHTYGGPAVTGALGWRFGNGLRAEVEGAWRSNDVSSVLTRRLNGELDPLTGVSGHVSTPSVMANLAYDIPISASPWALRPYVGVGAGYAWQDFAIHGIGNGRLNLPDDNTYVGPVNVNFGSAGAFAYQAMLGAALPIRSVRGLALTAEYRFFGVARGDVPVTRTATGGVVINGAVPTVVSPDGFQARDNILQLGLRYSFGP